MYLRVSLHLAQTFYFKIQIRIVTFPPEILRRNSLLTNLVIDDNTRSEFGVPDCDNVFVYMTDSTNPALIVYDSRKDSAWRISSPFMFPDPDYGTYRVSFKMPTQWPVPVVNFLLIKSISV